MNTFKILATAIALFLAMNIFYADACDHSKTKTKAGVENSVEMKNVSAKEGCCSSKMKTTAASEGCCSSKMKTTSATESSCSTKEVKTASSCATSCTTKDVKLEAKAEETESSVKTAEVVNPEVK